MVPDGRTDDAKTISLRLRRGIKIIIQDLVNAYLGESLARFVIFVSLPNGSRKETCIRFH